MYFNITGQTDSLKLRNTGRLIGNGTLTATGLFTWTGFGNLTFPFHAAIFEGLTLRAEGGMLMDGSYHTLMGGGTVRNFGAATWTSGDMAFKPAGGSATTRFVNEASGSLDLQYSAQMLSAGNISNNIFINAGAFTKSGGLGTSLFYPVSSNTASGAIHLNSGTLSFWTLENAGAIAVGDGATLAFHYHFSGSTYTQSAGSLALDGGTVTKTGSNLIINGGSVGGHGAINGRITNNGLVRAEGGLLTISNGVAETGGNIEIAPGASLALNGTASTASNLIHSGSDLALASNLTVYGDYQNANFGSGNSFDRRANVSGTGQILTGGATAQSVIGTDVSQGMTATPTLTFPVIREGQTTSATYFIQNPANSGPPLRGALQTSVNGGNITDPRLGGSGVTPGSFTLPSSSSTTAYTVELNGVSGGPLTGQSIHLHNNFSNVPDQTIALSGGVWGLAQPQITSTTPIEFGNVRIGKVLPYVPVAIKNNAPADGWHEGLSVEPLFSGIESEGPGEIVALAPQATDDTSIALRIPTEVVGPVAGGALLVFDSDGTGTSGISPNLNVGEAMIDVTGTVYDVAAPTLAETSHNFGTVRVGDVVSAFVLNVSNGAATYREGLNAAFDPSTVPIGYDLSGSIANLAPGASSAALEISMNTTTSGPRDSEDLRVNPASDGVATGEDAQALTPVPITLAGSVWNPAVPQIPGASTSLHLGNFRAGGPGFANIAVKNNAPDNGFSEHLIGEVADSNGHFFSESTFGPLLPQQTAETAVGVFFDKENPGPRIGNAFFRFTSSGSGTSGLDDLDLPQQIIDLTASVYRTAVGSVNNQVVGYLRLNQGDSISGPVRVTNTAVNDGFSERLIARVVKANPLDSTLSITTGVSPLIDPEADESSLHVSRSGIDSSAPGSFYSAVVVNFGSDGGGSPATSGFPELAVGSQAVTLEFRVNRPALSICSKSSGSPGTALDPVSSGYNGSFGSVPTHLGSRNMAILLRNGTTNSSHRDNLKATFNTSAMGPFSFQLHAPMPTEGLKPNEFAYFTISLNPAGLPAGPVTGSMEIYPVSSNPTSSEAQSTITLTFTADIEATDPYQLWAAENTLTGDDALPDADPDGDGHTNYAEYAFGGNPSDPNSGPVMVFRVLEDLDGKFLAALVRVRKGDESAFVASDDAPPFDRPSRAVRDGVSYVALAATTPGAAIDGVNILIPGDLLKVVPYDPPLGLEDVPPPVSLQYEDVAFRLMATTEEQLKAFFRMSAQPLIVPVE